MSTRSNSKTITLSDGRQLTLTLNFNAAADFEELTGENFFNAPNTATLARARVWALASQAEPDLKPRDVGVYLAPGTEDFDLIMSTITNLGGTTEASGSIPGGKGKAPRASGS